MISYSSYFSHKLYYTIRTFSHKDINWQISCPDDHHPHLIDLGLLSGTKWAYCNVGSILQEEYGGHYAWGEKRDKNVYSWSTYTHCDGTEGTCRDIGNDIAGTSYDVANVRWGSDWRMPSKKQLQELEVYDVFQKSVKFVQEEFFPAKSVVVQIFLLSLPCLSEFCFTLNSNILVSEIFDMAKS